MSVNISDLPGADGRRRLQPSQASVLDLLTDLLLEQMNAAFAFTWLEDGWEYLGICSRRCGEIDFVPRQPP